MTMEVLVAGAVLVGSGFLVRALLVLRRYILGLREAVREMARINVELACDLFDKGHFTAAAEHESLAAGLENLAETGK
ncbi:hypothetical protein FPZ12_026290 [Amycolatopsis acidicola]|uniref:Uncharacterized protein n=1 Tax=Amycolatopsis acidicola TaxID=2596893 RepID=A0A5N0UYV8_9PSEU|nr:hypothetical protein [Amycolatopsis acidicola]KAA9156928.1 hypothetical protein FPZ12_026290 [Amycolatopsis acidicola]